MPFNSTSTIHVENISTRAWQSSNMITKSQGIRARGKRPLRKQVFRNVEGGPYHTSAKMFGNYSSPNIVSYLQAWKLWQTIDEDGSTIFKTNHNISTYTWAIYLSKPIHLTEHQPRSLRVCSWRVQFPSSTSDQSQDCHDSLNRFQIKPSSLHIYIKLYPYPNPYTSRNINHEDHAFVHGAYGSVPPHQAALQDRCDTHLKQWWMA